MKALEKSVISKDQPGNRNVLWVDTNKDLLKYYGNNGWEALTNKKLSELENDKNYQTYEQVKTAIDNVVGSAPEALDTLKELSDALGGDANFSTTITNKFTEVNTSITDISETLSEIGTITSTDIANICK